MTNLPKFVHSADKLAEMRTKFHIIQAKLIMSVWCFTVHCEHYMWTFCHVIAHISWQNLAFKHYYFRCYDSLKRGLPYPVECILFLPQGRHCSPLWCTLHNIAPPRSGPRSTPRRVCKHNSALLVHRDQLLSETTLLLTPLEWCCKSYTFYLDFICIAYWIIPSFIQWTNTILHLWKRFARREKK